MDTCRLSIYRPSSARTSEGFGRLCGRSYGKAVCGRARAGCERRLAAPLPACANASLGILPPAYLRRENGRTGSASYTAAELLPADERKGHNMPSGPLRWTTTAYVTVVLLQIGILCCAARAVSPATRAVPTIPRRAHSPARASLGLLGLPQAATPAT